MLGKLSKTTWRIFSLRGGGGYPPYPLRENSAKTGIFGPKTLFLALFDHFIANIFGDFPLRVEGVLATQHIPIMTDSHPGGFLSVMMVGICQVTNSHHK